MASFISNLILALAIHGLKNKVLINKLETYWINEELEMHRRYSPFLLEVQLSQDLKTYLWPMVMVTLIVMILGLILCACNHWVLQGLGISLTLLATSVAGNLGRTWWRANQSGKLAAKEMV